MCVQDMSAKAWTNLTLGDECCSHAKAWIDPTLGDEWCSHSTALQDVSGKHVVI
jgi:hypothetical protein